MEIKSEVITRINKKEQKRITIEFLEQEFGIDSSNYVKKDRLHDLNGSYIRNATKRDKAVVLIIEDLRKFGNIPVLK